MMKNKKMHRASLSEKAEMALKEAVRNVVKDHKRTGDPVLVWQNGKVVRIPASRLHTT